MADTANGQFSSDLIQAPTDMLARASTLTVAAVDQIGERAAAEIDAAAEELMRGAQEIADHLHKLAAALRDSSKEAADHVGAYCTRATTVAAGVRELHEKFTADR